MAPKSLLYHYNHNFIQVRSRRCLNRKSKSFIIAVFAIVAFMLFINLQQRKIRKTPLPTRSNYSNPNYSTQKFNDMCDLPIIDPWDESMKPFLMDQPREKDPTENCDRAWRPYTELVDGVWNVTQEKEGRSCKARCFTPTGLNTQIKKSDWFPAGPTDCEFLEAACWEYGRQVYGYLHTQIRPHPLPTPPTNDSPDVFVFLVDSMSSGIMKRSLRKTVEFMTEKMGAIDFPFLNQVAIRSQPNAIPLWFGKQTEAGTLQGGKQIKVDWTEEYYCNKYLDDEPNIFSDFLNAGYTTNYIDDWSSQCLTSNPYCKGFQNYHSTHTFYHFTKILDYYSTPLTRKHLKGDKLCREIHLAALEFFEQFARAYSDRPKFVWSWSVHLAHGFLTGVNRLDKPMLELFERNFEMLNNAFVIIMADHGFRFEPKNFYKTDIGNLEKRNPALMISVPHRYRDNGILEVLKTNAGRLQSQYDVRATILDILKYQPASQFGDRNLLEIPDERGHSLIRQQPETPRNCETLPIIQQYCICKSKPVDMRNDTTLSDRLATGLINYVHDTLDRLNVTSLCHKYEFEQVTLLERFSSNSTASYRIIVKTKQPAVFETVVTDNETTGNLEFGEMERLDRYGTSTYCTKRIHYTSMCFCKKE